MERFIVSQFDFETFLVIDKVEEREICICGNYEEWTDAEKRAHQIADALNKEAGQKTKPGHQK